MSVDAKKKESSMNFPDFRSIPVRTKTFIVMTNIKIDIAKMYHTLPLTKYVIVPKRRGRKKKLPVTDPNTDIPDGSIISLDLEGVVRGVTLKKKKKNARKGDYFRNSITVVMIIDKKLINFKISGNGKFQMTGCKFDEQAERCIQYMWNYIKDRKELYTLPSLTKTISHPFRATFIPALRNIDFSLGFFLDRERLDNYINTSTSYRSLLETSIGYTGVNIKILVTKSIKSLMIKQLIFARGKWLPAKMVPYEYFLNSLKEKEKQKKLEKERYNTFLVFHSGKVIMSSMCTEFAEDTYNEFLELILKHRKLFEEQLSPRDTKIRDADCSQDLPRKTMKTTKKDIFKTDVSQEIP